MTHIFHIADWQVRLCFAHEDEQVGMHMLASFEPFRVEGSTLDVLFSMTVDQALEPVMSAECVSLRECDTNNGDVVVESFADGRYQFRFKDLSGEVCALMLGNADFSVCRCRVYGSKVQRRFGLNNALMLTGALAGARHQTLMVHASVVRHDGKGYAFVAPSGTGKSTQTQNWLRMIPGCDLMNDDNPVVRVIDGQAWIYGSPWSGKTPCYRQVKAPLAAVAKIARNADNYVEPLAPLAGFSHLLSSCSVMRWDRETFLGVCDTVSAVCSAVGNYTLHCTAEPQSAVVCYKGITGFNPSICART